MKRQLRLPILLLTLAMTLAGGSVAWQATSQKQAEGLSAAEFSRLIRELSEDGGHFPSDNFTSNESSYLTVVDKLRQLGVTGGAFIGVGPEQNFTYIAKIRPRIAFIVDIRRQAMIQHLMYKAIFHRAPARAQFLSLLLSRPLVKQEKLSTDAPVNALVTALNEIQPDDKTFAENLATIRRTIEDDFKFPLSETDLTTLEYVYKSFKKDGFEIGFRLSGRRRGAGSIAGGPGVPPFPGTGGQAASPGGFGPFPNLRDIITQTDLNGKQGNFLANAEDYDFVRGLHLRNLIIPVVGDFAGTRALGAVGDYLRRNSYTVSAFYTSNVEMVLFQNGIFDGFTRNVKKLPIDDRSLIIRAAFSRYAHEARLTGYGTFTILQQIPVFLRDVDEGRYLSYTDVINTHYIAADKPKSY